MEIIEKTLKELIPYANNPRKNDKAVDAVAESIKEFGFKVPCVIDSRGVVVCGHTRIKAARKLGMKAVPCVVADDLTEEQLRAFRLADNRTAEIAEWDLPMLAAELQAIDDVDMARLGFVAKTDAAEEFFNRERNDRSKQEGNDEYNAFVEKFEAKKTTDDCYTPDNVYDAVAAWVANEYDLDRASFVRPFYPGGDYKAFDYPAGCVVVDNPPFSIFAEIVNFYIDNSIKFFLLAPALTLLGSVRKACAVAVGVDVIYENGAIVNTSFATNLQREKIRSAPTLYHVLYDENYKNLKERHKNLPKYDYPDNVVTAAKIAVLSKYGVDFSVGAGESEFIRGLDAQKEHGKAIFGGGLLISEKAAAEKAAAEKAAALRWPLSDREKEIIRSLGK